MLNKFFKTHSGANCCRDCRDQAERNQKFINLLVLCAAIAVSIALFILFGFRK